MKPGAVLDIHALAPTQVLMGAAWVQKPVQALHAWQEPQLNALRKRLHALHQDWTDSWVGPVDSICGVDDIRIESAVAGARTADTPAAVLWSFESRDAVTARLSAHVFDPRIEDLDHLAKRAVARWMFDIREQGPIPDIARTTAEAAWTDWLARLAQRLGVPLRAMTDAAEAHDSAISGHDWSGTLRIRWPWGGGWFQLVVPGEVVQSLLRGEPVPSSSNAPASQRERVSLREALSSETIVLQVQLDGATLSLGQLQTLQLGDIVVLDHPLDAPVRILSTDATLVCEGWLGQQDGCVAIELNRPPMSSSNASPAVRGTGSPPLP